MGWKGAGKDAAGGGCGRSYDGFPGRGGAGRGGAERGMKGRK